MTPWLVELIAFGGLILLLLLGMPVSLAIGFITVVLVLILWPNGLFTVAAISINQGSSFLLSAIPLFILMAEFILVSGVSEKLYRSIHRWIGGLPGGLGIATNITGGVTAALTGSSPASEAMVGIIALPEMKRYNYSDRLSTGAIAAAGTLAILIPPSIPFVIYGFFNKLSIGKLFLAGIMPGILLVVLFSLMIWIRCKFDPKLGPPGPKFTWKEKFSSLVNVWPSVVLIFLVLVSIYLGWATPTEAAGLGALGSFVIALAFRTLTWPKLKDALLNTVKVTVMIMWIIMAGVAFGAVLDYARVPQHMMQAFAGLESPWAILTLIWVILAIAGCFIETASILVVLSPLLAPVAAAAGFDPYWFAVFFIIMLEMALITPPVGFNLFVMKAIYPEVEMIELYKGIMPFVLIEVLAIIILCIFPSIALWLPNLMK